LWASKRNGHVYVGTTDTTVVPNYFLNGYIICREACYASGIYTSTRSPAIAEGPRDGGVPVEIW